MTDVALIVPFTSSVAVGFGVLMPTLPFGRMCSRSALLVPRIKGAALLVPRTKPLPCQDRNSFHPPRRMPKRESVRPDPWDSKLQVATFDFVRTSATADRPALGF